MNEKAAIRARVSLKNCVHPADSRSIGETPPMSTAAPTISFSGLASGLDTTSIISQLTTTAQVPITTLNSQITGYNSQISDWQALNTNLAALQTAVSSLSSLHASVMDVAQIMPPLGQQIAGVRQKQKPD